MPPPPQEQPIKVLVVTKDAALVARVNEAVQTLCRSGDASSSSPRRLMKKVQPHPSPSTVRVVSTLPSAAAALCNWLVIVDLTSSSLCDGEEEEEEDMLPPSFSCWCALTAAATTSEQQRAVATSFNKSQCMGREIDIVRFLLLKQVLHQAGFADDG